jgi:hypothetical protein
MDSSHAKLQPQDPVAARLGNYLIRASYVLVSVLIAASFLRG